ncbi:unnamed protein product, partial [Discosporangium mesarthrocarpum]
MRVVVSLTTLPSRIQHIKPVLDSLKAQAVRPSAIYLIVPEFSLRESRGYDIPLFILEDPELTIIRSEVDYGPATKLIPLLQVETRPETVIITVDDDTWYPSSLLRDLAVAANRLPNMAVGLTGYRLPPGGDGP